MAGIKDVAKESGLSITTVSRVLNNRGYISQETREKVEKAIEALHYQPNELARSFYRKHTNILGVIVPAISSSFFGELVQRVETNASKNGYKVLLCNSHGQPQKEVDYIDMLKRNQVDGIIIASRTSDNRWFDNLSLPMLSIDRSINPGIPLIAADSYQGGWLATEHLIAKGCKKLAHIAGDLSLPLIANERSQAFEECCRKHHVPYAISCVTEGDLFGLSLSYDQIIELFQRNPDIDGFFASNELMAAQVFRYLHQQGRSIPGDVRVVGYDDDMFARCFYPALTTIAQPIEELSRYAVELLLRQIHGETVPSRTILPVSLVIRESA